MSDQTRELPEQPNLRFLKLEAKRRLAAGEFATLHEAQLAIAREHGLSSWTVLKETVTDDQTEPNLALAQVRRLISRFRDAGSATWVRPTAEDAREYFTEEFLAAVPPDTIIDMLIKAAAAFREGSLLPADLAAEALRPQAPHGNSGLRFGLGWPLQPSANLAGLVGGAPGAVASLLIVPGSGHASVVTASRLIPTAIEHVNIRLLRPNA